MRLAFSLFLCISAVFSQDLPRQLVIGAPYVPTPEAVVEEMLKLAGVTKDDVVYDLGCGDGRIVITAAEKFGARGVGVDHDPERIADARKRAEQKGVAGRVKFLEHDLFDVSLKEATVVTLYLLPEMNAELKPRFRSDLKPGTRIVSHAFGIADWKPDKTVEIGKVKLMLWTMPVREK